MKRRRRYALVLVLAAAAMTACGVRDTIDPVAAAATKTEGAGGYHLTMSMTIGAAGSMFSMHGRGDFEGAQGKLDMDMGDLLGQAGLPEGTDMTAQEILLTEDGDPVIYMGFPFLAGKLPGGASWMRMDLRKAGKALGIDLSRLMANSSQNPGQTLELLKAKGDFTEVGEETVDGVRTTHYHGVIDLEKALSSDEATHDAVQRLIAGGAPSSIPFDVWIDDSGFVRRLAQSYDQAVNGEVASVAMKLDLSDFGSTVDVSAPPADQVFDVTSAAASQLQNKLGGGTA